MMEEDKFSFGAECVCFKTHLYKVFHVEHVERKSIRNQLNDFLFYTLCYFWLHWMNAYTENDYASNCILYGLNILTKLNNQLGDDHAIDVELSYGYIRIFCKKVQTKSTVLKLI